MAEGRKRVDSKKEEIILEKFESEEQEEIPLKETTKKLTALVSILFRSKIYRPGDILPANDKKIVELWLQAGSAKWK